MEVVVIVVVLAGWIVGWQVVKLKRRFL